MIHACVSATLRALTTSALFAALAGCSDVAVDAGTSLALGASAQPASARPVSAQPEAELPPAQPLVDAPLEPWRVELLELSAKAAAAMPVRPHVKDRSLLQESIVTTALELEQPGAALAVIEQIENYRRGVGYADLALYCARHEAPNVERFLGLAVAAAETATDETEIESAQGWRRDRIRARIAAAHYALGQDERALGFATDLAESELGPVDVAQTLRAGREGLDAFLEVLDQAVATGSFELVKAKLLSAAELYGSLYDEVESRQRIEDELHAALEKQPPQFRVELLARLAEHALDHADAAQATRLSDEARVTLEATAWAPEAELPLRAQVAVLRFRAGDAEGARAELSATRAAFDARQGELLVTRRAAALRSIAEAFAAMGDRAGALATYTEVVEVGAANSNARPRAIDLVATCCSMASHDAEPDAALWSRLRQINDNLRDPW